MPKLSSSTFAGGAIFGLGSLFFLLFNGIFLGAMIGHVMAIGHGDQFWQFVVSAEVDDPQGVDTVKSFGSLLGAYIPDNGTEVFSGEYVVCDDVGGCFGSVKETDIGLSCANRADYEWRITILDQDDNPSEPFVLELED